MKIQLNKQYLHHIKNLSCDDYNIYKLPFTINDYEYIQETYNKTNNEYQYALGWICDNYFIPELFFMPDEQCILDTDNVSSSNDW